MKIRILQPLLMGAIVLSARQIASAQVEKSKTTSGFSLNESSQLDLEKKDDTANADTKANINLRKAAFKMEVKCAESKPMQLIMASTHRSQVFAASVIQGAARMQKANDAAIG